ncbi:uncharacterized protein LOC123673626 [Harmonia axyridis]|uniref:uncharacterized protein LOC123673626 n=1 Tax=Harmonia axyridis TaxID=115357 RepID=UPI001E2793BC|nr:uncharacterized protein LOC123673626 [Harmonia axyridis]
MAHTQFAIVFVLLASIDAKIYKKCELAKELKYKYDFDAKEIPVWVCIAKHESDFNTSAVNKGSGDHGLFQISDLYWCDTKRQGRACSADCKYFEDDDISDDIDCVKTIYGEHERISGNGFDAWVVYPLFCKNKTASYLEECFHQKATELAVNNSQGLNMEGFTTNNTSTDSVNKSMNSGVTLPSNKFKYTPSNVPPNIIFTSLGYFIYDTTTKSPGKIASKSPIKSMNLSSSYLGKYSASTTTRQPSSTTIKYPASNNNGHKHFDVDRKEKTVKLQSSGNIFGRISTTRDVWSQFKTKRNTTFTPFSHRENKTLKFSFAGNRLGKEKSGEDIVQKINLGNMYSFQINRRGGFQLRLL